MNGLRDELQRVFTLTGQQVAIVLAQSCWLTATAAGSGTETGMNVGEQTRRCYMREARDGRMDERESVCAIVPVTGS